jgi:hypothetical protein
MELASSAWDVAAILARRRSPILLTWIEKALLTFTPSPPY